MAEQYLYFRKATAVADDDDTANGSYMVPASAFLGASIPAAGSETDVELNFRSQRNTFVTDADGSGNADNVSDKVTVTCATNGQKAFLQALTTALHGDKTYNHNGMITVFDGVTGEAMGGSTGIVVVVQVAQA